MHETRTAPPTPIADPALDPDACWRAVESRDARFAGRFVLAVTSTHIYCRPGCPARLPRRSNARFYRTPAAAEHDGFRACRRCRPDAVPGTPAWAGASATVARAVRLIERDGLDGGVERLADRLGVTARHVRRLFAEHLGASPAAVARTRRAHFAARLIEQSTMPLADVAFASGFASVRAFHDAMRASFGTSPRALRRGRSEPGRPLEVRLAATPPFDPAGTLAFLAARAIPRLEQVEGTTYRRAVRAGERDGVIEIDAARDGLTLRVPAALAGHAFELSRRAARVFDLDADVGAIGRHLARDPLLAPLVRRRPALRVPGAWDPFETAVRGILGQQISVAAARTLAGRIVERWGEPIAEARDDRPSRTFPDAARLARVRLITIGLTRARAATLRSLARGVATGRLTLEADRGLDAAVSRLIEEPGIGAWTAHYLCLRAFGEPDAFPAADLGLLKAMERLGGPATAAALERHAERWKPWRGYAALHLWASLAHDEEER